jgi:hypothetical protein
MQLALEQQDELDRKHVSLYGMMDSKKIDGMRGGKSPPRSSPERD